MFMLPQESQQLEEQEFSLEGKKYTFYTPEIDEFLSPDQIQFLINQSSIILDLFLSYIKKGEGFVFKSPHNETPIPCNQVFEDEIKLEAKYCSWCSIFIESVPYDIGGYHTEVILYFWENSDNKAEIYKEIIWSNDNFVV